MSTEHKRIVWPLATVVAITAIAFIFATTRIGHGAYLKAELANSTPASVPALVQPVESTAPATVDDDDKGLWLTLRASGFENKETSIASGDYLIVIQNATGLDEIALRLQRENGERIYDVRLAKMKKRWRQRVHFTPGAYIVSEVDHPDWACRIVVTPSR